MQSQRESGQTKISVLNYPFTSSEIGNIIIVTQCNRNTEIVLFANCFIATKNGLTTSAAVTAPFNLLLTIVYAPPSPASFAIVRTHNHAITIDNGNIYVTNQMWHIDFSERGKCSLLLGLIFQLACSPVSWIWSVLQARSVYYIFKISHFRTVPGTAITLAYGTQGS